MGGFRLSRFRASGSLGCGGFGVSRFRGLGFQGLGGFRVSRFRGLGVQGLRGFQGLGCSGAKGFRALLFCVINGGCGRRWRAGGGPGIFSGVTMKRVIYIYMYLFTYIYVESIYWGPPIYGNYRIDLKESHSLPVYEPNPKP